MNTNYLQMKCMLFPLLLLVASTTAYSQEEQLTDTYKKEVIDSIAFQLKDKYVFPDVADLMADGLLNRSEEHTSELQSRENLVCRLLLEKKTPAGQAKPTRLVH